MATEDNPTSISSAMPTWELLSIDNPAFRIYATHASVLAVKVMLMSLYTGALRFKKKVFVNPEDLPKGINVVIEDHDVDRVRRAHLNDLENVVPYLLVALLFLLTQPSSLVAGICFRTVTLSRIVYTIVYAIYPLRQPIRSICFLITYFITIFMLINCIIYYCF